MTFLYLNCFFIRIYAMPNNVRIFLCKLFRPLPELYPQFYPPVIHILILHKPHKTELFTKLYTLSTEKRFNSHNFNSHFTRKPVFPVLFTIIKKIHKYCLKYKIKRGNRQKISYINIYKIIDTKGVSL